MKNKTTFRVLIILAVVLLIGVVSFFLFEGFSSIVNYVFLGELQLTGQVSNSVCENSGGSCRLSCIIGEYSVIYSCDPIDGGEEEFVGEADNNPDPLGGLIGQAILSEVGCCMPDSCGNGHLGIGEECDDGNTEGGDGCSSNCIIEYCGNNVCDVGETCPGCIQDCEGIIEEPACHTNQICANKYGLGICDPYEANPCGNGQIDSGEECDTNNLNDKLCGSFDGFLSGTLTCNNDCTFNKEGCLGIGDGEPDDVTDDTGLNANIPVVRKTCSEANGTCASTCREGDVHYGEEFSDNKCTEDYGVSLICCVSSGEESNNTYLSTDSDLPNDEEENSTYDYGQDPSREDSDVSPGGEIGTIESILSASNYLFVKIVILIILIFAVFFVMRKFHFSFWEKLTRRILFPASKKKVN